MLVVHRLLFGVYNGKSGAGFANYVCIFMTIIYEFMFENFEDPIVVYRIISKFWLHEIARVR